MVDNRDIIELLQQQTIQQQNITAHIDCLEEILK